LLTPLVTELFVRTRFSSVSWLTSPHPSLPLSSLRPRLRAAVVLPHYGWGDGRGVSRLGFLAARFREGTRTRAVREDRAVAISNWSWNRNGS